MLDIAPFVSPGGGGVVSVSSDARGVPLDRRGEAVEPRPGIERSRKRPSDVLRVHDSGGTPSSYAHNPGSAQQGTTAFVGRVATQITAIDVRTGVITAVADVEGASCREGTSVMAGHAPERVDRLRRLRRRAVPQGPEGEEPAGGGEPEPAGAHSAGVSDVAVSADNNLIVTCGMTRDRMGNTVADSFLKIVDVRAGMRPLGVSQFPPGASFVCLRPEVVVRGAGVRKQRVRSAGRRRCVYFFIVFFGSQSTDAFLLFRTFLLQVRRSPTRFRRFTR